MPTQAKSKDSIGDRMRDSAIELDKWLRFASCQHIGYINTAVGIENPGDDVGLIIYWDKTRMKPGGMPETFNEFPIVFKLMGKPIPA